MTQVFEVKKIDGKGLGWVANKNIKRGSVIFTENPQLEFSLEQKIPNLWRSTLIQIGLRK